MINPNWVRWIFASIAKHLRDVATTDEHLYLLEGIDERTDKILESDLWVEHRITGPLIQQQPGQYRIWVDSNVLLHTKRDDYEIQRICGLYAAAYSQPIQVWNYGKLAGDYVAGEPSTKVLLGCLTPKPTKAENISVFHFGRIQATDKVRQSIVDVTLEMYL